MKIKDFGNTISNNTLREMIEIGNKLSFGSKITGAGGVEVFFLTNEKNAEETLNEFKNKNYECFSVKIDFKGLDTFNELNNLKHHDSH